MTPPPALDARASERLAAFADAVRASPHNLLSRRALEELETRHIAESLAFAATLPSGGPGRLLDLGTGGGFPGMVVAIARPDLQVTLLDATTKKIDFLRTAATQLELDVDLITGRAEEVQRDHAGAFDIVTARAVAPLERLAGWALPFLAPGGQLHAIKGERWAEELRAALPALRRVGATVVSAPNTQPATAASDAAGPRVVIIRAAG